jgi:hypothetical protein
MAQGVLFIMACASLFGLAAFLFRDQMRSCDLRQSSNPSARVAISRATDRLRDVDDNQ